MPNTVDLSDEIQAMISHAPLLSKLAEANGKLSTNDPDPVSLDACKKLVNWEYPRKRSSWKQAIMNEIENLKKFDVCKIIPLSSVPSGAKILLIVTGHFIKRTKAGTLEHEEVDKRKCGMCLGSRKAIKGVHYNRIDVYAPVPKWSAIKLQPALTSQHHLQLKAFDCVTAYLQADLKDSLYVYPPKRLMQELGQNPNKIWMLNKALYRLPPPGDAGGMILLNLYSDDSLGSTDN